MTPASATTLPRKKCNFVLACIDSDEFQSLLFPHTHKKEKGNRNTKTCNILKLVKILWSPKWQGPAVTNVSSVDQAPGRVATKLNSPALTYQLWLVQEREKISS